MNGKYVDQPRTSTDSTSQASNHMFMIWHYFDYNNKTDTTKCRNCSTMINGKHPLALVKHLKLHPDKHKEFRDLKNDGSSTNNNDTRASEPAVEVKNENGKRPPSPKQSKVKVPKSAKQSKMEALPRGQNLDTTYAVRIKTNLPLFENTQQDKAENHSSANYYTSSNHHEPSSVSRPNENKHYEHMLPPTHNCAVDLNQVSSSTNFEQAHPVQEPIVNESNQIERAPKDFEQILEPIDDFMNRLKANLDEEHAVKPKTELQKRMEVAISLFMSQTQIQGSFDNYHFRQFISSICPELELPLIGSQTTDCCLNFTYFDLLDKMDEKLKNVQKFTLMLNFVRLKAFEEDVIFLCISIAYETENKLEVMLLNVKEIYIDPSELIINVQGLVGDTLDKYDLNASQIVRTIADGFEECDIESDCVLITHRLDCNYQRQILDSMNEVFEESNLYNHVKEKFLQMLQSFCSIDEAIYLFDKVTGFKINLEHMPFEKLLWILLHYRTEFSNTCLRYAFTARLKLIEMFEWEILEDFFYLRSFIFKQLQLHKNEYITIGEIIPQVKNLIYLLQENFAMLDNVPKLIVEKINQKLNYMFDMDDLMFEPIYLQATYLHPKHFPFFLKDENKALLEVAQFVVEKQFHKFVYETDELPENLDAFNSTAENVLPVGDDLKRNQFIDHYFAAFTKIQKDQEINQKKSATLIEQYYNHMLTFNEKGRSQLNPYEYWKMNKSKYESLSQFALDFLYIPAKATLPHSNELDDDPKLLVGDDFSLKDPLDFIKKAENLRDLKRDALLELNKHLFSFIVEQKVEESNKDDSDQTIETTESNARSNSPEKDKENTEQPNTPTTSVPLQSKQISFPPPLQAPYLLPTQMPKHKPPFQLNNVLSPSSFKAPISQYTLTGLPPPGFTKIPSKPVVQNNSTNSDDKSKIIMVNNVSQFVFNCGHLFNLLSCYGSVLKIKFPFSCPNSCFVEMASATQAKNVLKYLNLVCVFNTVLKMRQSNTNTAVENKQAFELKSGGMSYMEYNETVVNEEDLCEPTPQVFYSGVPIEYDEEKIKELLKRSQSIRMSAPRYITRFQIYGKDMLSGILVFSSVEQAANAIAYCNNMQIDESHTLQLRFTAEEPDV